jgi:hypothetical protein
MTVSMCSLEALWSFFLRSLKPYLVKIFVGGPFIHNLCSVIFKLRQTMDVPFWFFDVPFFRGCFVYSSIICSSLCFALFSVFF